MNISPFAGSPVSFSSVCPAHDRYKKYICFYISAIFILRLYEGIFAYSLDITLGNIGKIIPGDLRIPNTDIYLTTGTYLV